MKPLLLLLLAVVLPCWVMAQGRGAAATTTTLHDFEVPSYDEQGHLSSKLLGRFAKIYPDRMAEITDLQIDFFKIGDTNRMVDVRVTSPHCFYHPDMGVAAADDAIRLSRENMVVTGSNYVVNARAQRLKIGKNAKVVITGMRSTNTVLGVNKP